MPLNIDLLQILLHALNFIILAGGLIFLLYRPINKFLQGRKEYFEKAQKEIEIKTEENEKLSAEYEEKLKIASKEIAEMRLNAEKEIAEISKTTIEDAKEKASAIVLAAEKEAEDRKEHILDAAGTEIGELIVTATQKLLSNTVTPERNTELYDEFIRLAEENMKNKRNSK